jgi:2,4-dienoyl-CoA reductase-like NADH-dependent reductase (Old Yellow Enzyme family)
VRSRVLEPLAHARLQPVLRNRIAVAAMSRMQAREDGCVSADMPAYYERYVRGGAGLVFTEALYTDETAARAYFNQPGLASDVQAESWRQVVDRVHAAGGVLFAQLQHGGRLCEPGLNGKHLAASDGAAAGNTWQTGRPNAPARAAGHSEIGAIVEGFANAARRAREVGFDGVELHGARGYLLDDFLSATSNRRTDEYGGSLEGRLKLPLRVVKAVRDAVGPLPLSYNLSLYKMDDAAYQPPGGADEIRTIARALRGAGVDVLHVTTRRLLRDEPWGEPLVQTVRASVPDRIVIGNGGIKTLDDAQAAIVAVGCDMVSIARPFLANPDWLERNLRGDTLQAYRPGQEREQLLSR